MAFELQLKFRRYLFLFFFLHAIQIRRVKSGYKSLVAKPKSRRNRYVRTYSYTIRTCSSIVRKKNQGGDLSRFHEKVFQFCHAT